MSMYSAFVDVVMPPPSEPTRIDRDLALALADLMPDHERASRIVCDDIDRGVRILLHDVRANRTRLYDLAGPCGRCARLGGAVGATTEQIALALAAGEASLDEEKDSECGYVLGAGSHGDHVQWRDYEHEQAAAFYRGFCRSLRAAIAPAALSDRDDRDFSHSRERD